MTTFLTIIHVIACITLILIVLLQAGKGANMGAAFGGSSQTVFGSSGAGTFLGKMTAAVAIIFMLTSITLTYTSSRRTTGSGVMDNVSVPADKQKVPAVPKPVLPSTTQPVQPLQPSLPATSPAKAPAVPVKVPMTVPAKSPVAPVPSPGQSKSNANAPVQAPVTTKGATPGAPLAK
jgi:preprotein translocase subunit SecG